jgi:GNAT superfamily N-acetyltransferase
MIPQKHKNTPIFYLVQGGLMATAVEITRLQNYLRASARRQYDALSLPPFTLFFHPQDALKYFNYAIPDGPCEGDLSDVLADLREEYQRRGRTARFEFYEAFAPQLPAILRQNGFSEEGRQWSMLCTPDTALSVPDVAGLEIVRLTPQSSPQEMHDFISVQQEGFSPEDNSEPDPNAIQHMLADLQKGHWHAYLGRVAGQAASVASFGAPIDGITEVAGIATRPSLRRMGIAAKLTEYAVRTAFEMGVQTVCLTAADERAGRVYERAGFRPFSIMLAYS